MRQVPVSPTVRPRLLDQPAEDALLYDVAAAADAERDAVEYADEARLYRNALIKRAIDAGVPYREVAYCCGLSLGTVTRAVAHVRQRAPPLPRRRRPR